MSTVTDTRKVLNRIVEFFKSRKEYVEEVTWFATLVRYLEPKTLMDADAFHIQPELEVCTLPEEFRSDTYGLCRGVYFRYSGRFIYPVKDVRGDVMGWCGYDKFELPKYKDSDNFGYKAKEATVYGMEKLEEYYRSGKTVFFVEGIVCCLYLRQMGLQALALLGSHYTPYVGQIIKRFGMRAIVIPDSDEAGNKLVKQLRYLKCHATVIQSSIAKDIDDSRQVDPTLVEELLKFSTPGYISKLFYTLVA